MKRLFQLLKNWVGGLLLGGISLWQIGCSTPGQTAGLIAGGVVGTTIVGAHSPTQEIEQIYYLGVFDPQDQVPPTIYRVTVHGQASFISGIEFGSGWVPSQLIDSLGSHIKFDVNDNSSNLEFSKGSTEELSTLASGRRLMMFGPEGFREAPANHRLVLVMGASPKAFFETVDQVLGRVATAKIRQLDSQLQKKLFEAINKSKAEQNEIQKIQAKLEKESF